MLQCVFDITFIVYILIISYNYRASSSAKRTVGKATCFFGELVHCNQKSLSLGKKQSVEFRGIGKIMIKRLVDGQWEYRILERVLYVSNLRRNLFSEEVIVRKG